jgi:hypothetical protein
MQLSREKRTPSSVCGAQRQRREMEQRQRAVQPHQADDECCGAGAAKKAIAKSEQAKEAAPSVKTEDVEEEPSLLVHTCVEQSLKIRMARVLQNKIRLARERRTPSS